MTLIGVIIIIISMIVSPTFKFLGIFLLVAYLIIKIAYLLKILLGKCSKRKKQANVIIDSINIVAIIVIIFIILNLG